MSKTGIIYGVNGPVIYLKGDTGFKISAEFGLMRFPPKVGA